MSAAVGGQATSRASGPPQAFGLPRPVGSAVQQTTSLVNGSVARVRHVADARGGLPVYAGAAGMAVLGVLEWPVAVAVGAGYAALRRWGGRLPEPVRSLTGSQTRKGR